MQLVVAEKPSVANSIADALGVNNRNDGFIEGNGYIVTWCIGHLVSLAEADIYDSKHKKWNIEDLPIIPKQWEYTVIQSKQKQFKIVKRLMNRSDVTRIINATDAGREGELIFRLVYHKADCKKPFSRLWISNLEESTIIKGFDELKDGKEYDALYDSALCRAKADWLIGINSTRLYSILHNKTLNIGRVQTPTLAMLVERNYTISNFAKEKYYTARIKQGGIEAVSDRLKTMEEANLIQAACLNRQAVCYVVKKEQKITAAPKLFDLTSLQREANRLFGYTAKQTLDIAQKLYENKIITYPRTDSKFLPSVMSSNLPGLAHISAAYIGINTSVPVNSGRVINDKKVSDHHAILPNMNLGKAIGLPEYERNVIKLIATRLVCALADEHVYESVKAVFECNKHYFTATGRNIIKDGWKAYEQKFYSTITEPETEDSTDEDHDKILPPIIQGQIFSNVVPTVKEHFTQPPKQYTENTLLSAMEKAGQKVHINHETGVRTKTEKIGLGTPATRAAIIEKLISCGFAKRKGRQILPTPEGEFLISAVPNALKTPSLTAQWEKILTDMAAGKFDTDDFMLSIEEMVDGIILQEVIKK